MAHARQASSSRIFTNASIDKLLGRGERRPSVAMTTRTDAPAASLRMIVAPVTHIFYYVFLLPAWTALFGYLAGRRLTWPTAALWAALVSSYLLMGFDAPLLALNRVAPVLARPILDHWLGFIPVVLLLSFAALASNLLLFHRRPDLARAS